jgi:hypothetical protein
VFFPNFPGAYSDEIFSGFCHIECRLFRSLVRSSFRRAVSGSSNHPREGAVLLGLGQNSGHNSFPVHGEASTDKRTSIEIVQQTS